MKKVEFGYNNDIILNGSFQGFGSYSSDDKAFGPTSGLVVDVVNINNEDYLITKITSDYEDSNVGKYDVRKVAVKKYDDGSSAIFTPNSTDKFTSFVSDIVNSPIFNAIMSNGASPYIILQGLNFDAYQSKDIGYFDNNVEDVPILVTGISDKNFDSVKNSVEQKHY